RASLAAGDLAGPEVAHDLVAEQPERGLVERHLHGRAAAALERGEDPEGRPETCREVDERDSDADRRHAVHAGDAHDPACRLQERVVSGLHAKRPGRAERSDRAVHELGPPFAHRLRAEAVLLGGAGPKALHEHVGAVDEPHQLLGSLHAREVEDERALACVRGEEHRTLAVEERRPPCTRVVPAGRLDLDHVRAERGEQLRARRTGERGGDVDDEPPLERMEAHGVRRSKRSVSIKRHHDRALELDHDLVALVEAARPHRDDALPGSRARLALLDHLRLGTDGVPREDRRGQPHLAPAEVDGTLGDVGDRQPGDEGEREGRVDERPLPLGRGSVLRVEVDGIRVQRQEREPDVVGVEYGAAEAAAIDRSHLQLVVRAAHAADHMNRLAHETSPYLLQHAHNPVDWYPWGEEAFARAHEEDKPVLLSVGYAACHWCQVMEHESFEDDETAALMNELFVSVKVDREERPDVDAVYMDAVVSLTGQGGWPMTVFLTPDGEPFFGGTYYPPEPRHGLPSFRQLLVAISNAYHERREDVAEQAKAIVDALRQSAERPPSREPLERGLVAEAVRVLRGQFDPEWGGFGRAPK